MYYKLPPKDDKGLSPTSVAKIDGDFILGIPFDPANTDYQQFKQAINDDTAQLEDADGNVMSAQEAKQFVSTLP